MSKARAGLVLGSLALFILLASNGARGQEQARAAMRPVGEEAYQVIAEVYGYDKGIPLEPKLVQREAFFGVARDKIVFRGSRGDRVPAYLSLPAGDAGPYPVVLLAHGIGGSKRVWWEDDSFESGGIVTKKLLERGFAVMALDSQYCGERTLNNDYEQAMTMTFSGDRPNRARDMMIQSAMDYRRAIDYLESRSDIDADRVGVLGYSLGGMFTFYLSALDTRVRVGVACATPLQAPHGFGLGASVAMENFAGAIDEVAFLMLMGRTDETFTTEQAETVFGLIESPAKRLEFFDSGHRLPADYTDVAVAWIGQHLGGQP